MTNQNVTLSLPKETLQKAKILAIRRNTSLSGMMTRLLDDLVRREDEYVIAANEYRKMLREVDSLGGYKARFSRDDLHER